MFDTKVKILSTGFIIGAFITLMVIGNSYTINQEFVGYSDDHFDCALMSDTSYTPYPANGKLTRSVVSMFNPSDVDVNYTIYGISSESDYNWASNATPEEEDLYFKHSGKLAAKETKIIVDEHFKLLDNYLITGFINDTSVALIIRTQETFTVYRF